MKKITQILTIAFTISTASLNAQLAEDSWSLGFGGTYPRFMGIWSKAYSGTANYGAYFSLQRNFSENVGVRFLVNYLYIEALYDFPPPDQIVANKLTSASIDLLYYLVPCDPISPYMGAGFAGIYHRPKNAFEPELDEYFLEYQLNLRAGAEWKISENWRAVTELGYFTPSSNKLDGENDTHEHKGLFGTNCDSYMAFNLGFLYYFSKGNPSQKCDLYSGLTVGARSSGQLTIQDIEKVVKDNLPKEVVKEVVVEKPTQPIEKRWILAGVNFEFNSANLTKESFPILLNALQILTDNPDMHIEIRGYADNIGNENYNQILSERRAKVVKDYLVGNGISPERLSIKGYGELDPIGDNNTIEGRTLNRRIEFKVIK
jgi:OOP family OmpA-OmpF porin